MTMTHIDHRARECYDMFRIIQIDCIKQELDKVVNMEKQRIIDCINTLIDENKKKKQYVNACKDIIKEIKNGDGQERIL